jgi:hypothetical protein
MTRRLDAPLARHDACGRCGGLVVTGICENGGASLDGLDAKGDEDDDRRPVELGSRARHG